MYNRILTLLAIVTISYSHDVIVGTRTDGRKIFDETREASPAIWRQVQNITVNATDAEVISRVVVTDQRPEKDGEAKVIEGGDGQKSVTLELKSPTALRGYDFHIEVYTSPDDKASAVTGKPDEPNPTRVQRNPENADKTGFNVPRTSFDGTTKLPDSNTNVPVLFKDTKVNDNSNNGNPDAGSISSTEANYNAPRANFPTNVPIQPNNGQVRNSRDSAKANDEGIIPKITGSNPTITPKVSLHSQNTSVSSDYGLKTSESPRNSRDTQAEGDNKKTDAKDLPTLVPLNVAKNLDNGTHDLKTDVKRASEHNERENNDEITTPYYPEYHSHIIPSEPIQNRKTRDTVKTSSTQIPRLLTENKPTAVGKEPELTVLPAQRFNGRTSTTPKAANVRIARDSDENGEASPPIFQNAPETPEEDSRFLFQANNLPINRPTSKATTTTTTVKSERKRDIEAESPVTRNPKLEDDYKPRAEQNGTRLLPPKPVISLQ